MRIELAVLVVLTGIGLGVNHMYRLVKWEEARVLGLAFAISYLFSSLLLSPDLDLGRSDSQNRWGMLRVLWLPYAALFRHRGLSHNPLFGPLTRIGYLGLLVAAAMAGLHYGFEVDLAFLEYWWEKLDGTPLWAIGIGLMLPNEIHILADRLLKN